MTFPWARILLMLLIVGLSSLFLINSHLSMMPTAQLNFTPVNSVSYSDCVALSSHDEADCDMSSATLSPLSNIDTFIISNVIYSGVIDVNTTLLGFVGSDSVSSGSKPQPNSNDIHYVPTYSARYINLAQHQPDEVNPRYVFAYEFVSPPIPILQIGYQINFSPQLDWVLTATSGPSRISAWKESNQLFVHSHTC
ncbi:hypothetical protein [Shewanella sp.]|uniref:hypothetical protein n=2 Tax=Shewanella sp. TaxID=50422 RepID=UPI0040475806